MGLLGDGLDPSIFSGCDIPDQQDGDKAHDDGKNKSPEIVLGPVIDESSHPRPDRSTDPNISFDHAVDETKIFSLIEIS
jgi:hypothetical protein